MGQVPLVSANLATVCIESLLYGIFLVLFTTSSYFLLHRQQVMDGRGKGLKALQWRHFRSPMLLAGIAIWMGVTAHWCITVTRLFDAFVNFEGGAEPELFWGDLAQPTNVVKTAIFVTTVLISDAMIIYRLYVIWNYRFLIIAFPVLTWCGLAISGYASTYHFSVYSLGQNVFNSAMGRWITCDASFTLITNLYCTAMIAWKVWQTKRRITPIGAANMSNVLAIIIESAAIYSSWNIFFLASYEAESNVQFPAIDVWNCVAGISYMLINVRVGLGWAQTADSDTTAMSTFHATVPVFTSGTYAMNSVSVHVTETAENDEGVYSYGKKARPRDAEISQTA